MLIYGKSGRHRHAYATHTGSRLHLPAKTIVPVSILRICTCGQRNGRKNATHIFSKRVHSITVQMLWYGRVLNV
eukprot:2248118-Prorocentrum_lima.AAC.1